MLFVLLILWPVAEVFVVIKVAEAIGVLDTIVLLILGWPLGIWAIRTEGRTVLRRMSATVAAGRTPAREVLDGVLVLLGGLLLIIPGFITDALGLVLLLPPSRIAVRALLARNAQSRFVTRAVRFSGGAYDAEATATDIDQPQLRP